MPPETRPKPPRDGASGGRPSRRKKPAPTANGARPEAALRAAGGVRSATSPRAAPHEVAIAKETFVRALRESRSTIVATMKAGVSRCTLWRWRAEDANFARAWSEAWEECVDELESAVLRRAIDGQVREEWRGGRWVPVERAHSPQREAFVLAKLRPATYGDQALEARLRALEERLAAAEVTKGPKA